jgi:hypothetical protein
LSRKIFDYEGDPCYIEHILLKGAGMKEISNRILKTALVRWRKLEWLQAHNLKTMTEESFEKLKRSLVKNNFVDPFKIWQDEKKRWILDGHHRERAMKDLEKEGVKIPDLLPANFIQCADRKEAVKLVFIYSSIYARITEQGLKDTLTLEDLDIDELLKEIDLPDLDLAKGLGKGWDKDIPEKEENIRPYKKTHILLSFPPASLVKIQPFIKEILKFEEVEYEQGSN